MATAAGNHSNGTDVSSTLSDLNDAELTRLVPVIVYLVFLSVSGTAGNSIVFHVYRTRYRRSNFKSFVLCLCSIDLFSCMVAMPLEILTVLDQYTFNNIWLCKIARFSNYSTAMSSSWLIAIIASERYRKVCKPFKWQISVKAGMCLCVFSIICGSLSAAPAIFIFGKKSYIVPMYDIIGTECSTDDSMVGKALTTFHIILSGCLFATAVIVIVVLYTIIGRTLHKHEQAMPKHFRFRREGSQGPVSHCQSQDGTDTGRRHSAEVQPAATKEATYNTQNGIGNKIVTNTNSIHKLIPNSEQSPKLQWKNLCESNNVVSIKTSVYPNLHPENGYDPNYQSIQNTSRSNSQVSTAGRLQSLVDKTISGQTNTSKTVLLMFMVSVAFVLSYTPHLILMFCRLGDEKFVDNLSDTSRAVYKFFLRSYFVNYAINPVIYCLCGSKFRSQCKDLVCGKCTKK